MDTDAILKRVGEFWNRPDAVAQYDTLKGHGVHSEAEIDAWVAAMQKHLPDAPADVLDVGTGTGMLALIAARLGHRVTGIDLSPGMLGVARSKASGMTNPPRFESGDAVDPPFSPASFDVVCNRHVLWTLPDPDKALSSWLRLLRPGGRLIVIDALWFNNRPQAEDPEDNERRQAFEQVYTPDVVRRMRVMNFTSVEQVADLLSQSGYNDVSLSGLSEVERIENASGESGREEPPRYVVTGRKPAAA